MNPQSMPALDPSLARYREHYPILADTTYMNSNSMGAMPRQAKEALHRYTEDWVTQGVEVWGEWIRTVDEVSDAAAQFIGAPAGQTILNQ
ncbi:MAG TPA: hypothetical protein ENK31_05470, partial [Nannocystis exedens]|nr:hypothetical protein [Nannocystis exedens]